MGGKRRQKRVAQMKKISSRSATVWLLAAVVVLGLFVYVRNQYESGKRWAMYFPTFSAAAEGTIYDRSGECLVTFEGSDSTFAGDAVVREANYHVTGDFWGRTGTGLLSRFWSNAQGYSFFRGTTVSSVSELNLTVDSSLNTRAYLLLRNTAEGLGRGAIMISNYKTGEIICMVSSPSIDPENSSAEPEEGAYINRCISSVFTPGSTFKLVTSAAALENLADIDTRKYLCEGEYDIAGVKITCTTSHGYQTFEQALANSCNCAFARITVLLGQDTMVKYVQDYGFMSAHTLDGMQTSAGTFPTEFVGDPELAWAGIGQSTDTVCPYTMLRYVSAIANGGILTEPTLINDGVPQGSSRLMNAETADALKELMKNNVRTHYEGDIRFPGLNLAAKTGTAETGTGTSHSWFTGFLDDEEHPYAFVATVEEGGFGLWTAGLMMNDILQYLVSCE